MMELTVLLFDKKGIYIFHLQLSRFDTYLEFSVILYHSVFHYKCRPERGYIRACLKSNVCFTFSQNFCGN